MSSVYTIKDLQPGGRLYRPDLNERFGPDTTEALASIETTIQYLQQIQSKSQEVFSRMGCLIEQIEDATKKIDEREREYAKTGIWSRTAEKISLSGTLYTAIGLGITYYCYSKRFA